MKHKKAIRRGIEKAKTWRRDVAIYHKKGSYLYMIRGGSGEVDRKAIPRHGELIKIIRWKNPKEKE